MIISLSELYSNKDITIKYDVIKDDELDKRILDLEDSVVEGRIYLNSENDIILKCVFTGKMILEDSVTLEHVPYEFSINIEESLEELEENYLNCYNKHKNTLDLKEVLWQNIVLEVPISYTKVIDASLRGNGWELVDKEKKEEEIDPRLKKLEELLERRD